jgi:hypothetical protein
VLYVVLHLFILRSDCYRDKSPFGVWDLRKGKQHVLDTDSIYRVKVSFVNGLFQVNKVCKSSVQ